MIYGGVDYYMKISVVVPLFNEEANAEFVLREARDVLAKLNVDFEIIAIDDGSTDATGAVLKKISQEISELCVLTQPVNHGQDAALWRGFQNTSGYVIVMIDGDGQNDLHDLPRMLNFLGEYDAVFGQRAKRLDPPQKIIASRIAFLFRRLVLGDTCPDTSCSLKVMKRHTLHYIIPIRGFIRFIPFLFQQAGVPCIYVDVNHRKRISGKSKYSLIKLYFLSTIADLIFMWWYKKRNILKTLSTVNKDIKPCQKR